MNDLWSREADLEWFAGFVQDSRWRFARTYAQSYPHEYTLQHWTDADVFSRAILCIERWGVLEPFWRTWRKYLRVGDRKYWHMGDASSEKLEERPTLINRAWLDQANYREDARALGYDDQSLDRLIGRWKRLSERARRVQPRDMRSHSAGRYLGSARRCRLCWSSSIVESAASTCP